MARCEVVVPDLGVKDQPIVVSVWLVDGGELVAEGQPLLEVLVGGAVVDLPAPADGLLVKKCVAEDQPVEVGQRLAIIEVDAEE